jgi:phage head maturation protease
MLVHKSAAVVQIGGDFHFVMSDASVDRMGDVIESAGWDLTTFKSHPVALFNHGKQDPLPIGTWSDVRVENGQLRGKLNFAAPGTSPRIDEMRSLLEQGILRAASVGFEPVEYEPRIKGTGAAGGRRYMRQRLVECSLVTIPANANALQIAKSLNISDDTMHFVFGEQANGDEEPVRRHIGKQAATPPARRAGIMNLSVSKRIEDAQQAIVRAQDALTNHLADENADPKFGDDLTAEIETKQAELDRLKRAEAVLAVKTVDKPLEGEILSPQRPFALPKAPTPKPRITSGVRRRPWSLRSVPSAVSMTCVSSSTARTRLRASSPMLWSTRRRPRRRPLRLRDGRRNWFRRSPGLSRIAYAGFGVSGAGGSRPASQLRQKRRYQHPVPGCDADDCRELCR